MHNVVNLCFFLPQEQTKYEVQDAKLTLAAQLRATKEMVVDASITAQRASRWIIDSIS